MRSAHGSERGVRLGARDGPCAGRPLLAHRVPLRQAPEAWHDGGGLLTSSLARETVTLGSQPRMGPTGGDWAQSHPEAEASDRTRPFPLPGPVATKPIANRDFPQEEPPAQISSKAAPAWRSQRGGGGGPGGRRNSGKRGRVRGTLAAGATGHPTSSHPTVRTMGNSGTGSKVPRPDVSLWTAPRAAARASRRDRGHKSARRPVSAGVGTGAGGGSAAGAGGQRHGAGARPSSAGVRKVGRGSANGIRSILIGQKQIRREGRKKREGKRKKDGERSHTAVTEEEIRLNSSHSGDQEGGLGRGTGSKRAAPRGSGQGGGRQIRRGCEDEPRGDGHHRSADADHVPREGPLGAVSREGRRPAEPNLRPLGRVHLRAAEQPRELGKQPDASAWRRRGPRAGSQGRWRRWGRRPAPAWPGVRA